MKQTSDPLGQLRTVIMRIMHETDRLTYVYPSQEAYYKGKLDAYNTCLLNIKDIKHDRKLKNPRGGSNPR